MYKNTKFIEYPFSIQINFFFGSYSFQICSFVLNFTLLSLAMPNITMSQDGPEVAEPGSYWKLFSIPWKFARKFTMQGNLSIDPSLNCRQPLVLPYCKPENLLFYHGDHFCMPVLARISQPIPTVSFVLRKNKEYELTQRLVNFPFQ